MRMIATELQKVSYHEVAGSEDAVWAHSSSAQVGAVGSKHLFLLQNLRLRVVVNGSMGIGQRLTDE